MSAVSEKQLKFEWSPAAASSAGQDSIAHVQMLCPSRASKPSFMLQMPSLDLKVNACVNTDGCLNAFFMTDSS